MSATAAHKATWPLIGLLAFLGMTLVTAFPAYEDADFQELKQILEQAKRGMVDDFDNGYLPDIYDYVRKGKGYSRGYFVDEEVGKMAQVKKWPKAKLDIGEVGGLAVEGNGDVNVFHRAGRKWTEDSFNANHTYKKREEGPIAQATVSVLEPDSGTLRSYWGAEQFYLPHGITVDPKGNFWLTDVAMHQVFKFEPGKLEKPTITLGKAFEPAINDEDTERFCKPTDVAVASDGTVFVADGYCRSRVMKYDSNGKFLGKFGDDEFDVPHSLALAEDLDLLCVADRENYRIVCFNAGLKDHREFGTPDREYTDYKLGRVYAIAYSPKDGFLYGVTWQDDETGAGEGFTMDLHDDARYKDDILSFWKTGKQGFFEPHTLAVSQDGNNVYVGEIHDEGDRQRVWKFTKADLGKPEPKADDYLRVEDGEEDPEDDEDDEDEDEDEDQQIHGEQHDDDDEDEEDDQEENMLQ